MSNKLEQLKSELNQAVFFLVCFSGVTTLCIYLLAMAWVNHNLLGFFVTGIFAACAAWLTWMQGLTVLHQSQKVGREQLRLDLEDAKQRFDIKF